MNIMETMKTAQILPPASDGHQYELLARSGKLGIDRIFRFKGDTELSTRTAHHILGKLIEHMKGGDSIMIELSLGDKDPAWWKDKLERCGFHIIEHLTERIRRGSRWEDVWVCLKP